MHHLVLRYDQESAHQGLHLLAHYYDEGWETYQPVVFTNGFYHTVLYWPESI